MLKHWLYNSIFSLGGLNMFNTYLVNSKWLTCYVWHENGTSERHMSTRICVQVIYYSSFTTTVLPVRRTCCETHSIEHQMIPPSPAHVASPPPTQSEKGTENTQIIDSGHQPLYAAFVQMSFHRWTCHQCVCTCPQPYAKNGSAHFIYWHILLLVWFYHIEEKRQNAQWIKYIYKHGSTTFVIQAEVSCLVLKLLL